MDSRLCRNVESQLKPEDTWDQMGAVAESYEATMYKTGGYKDSNRRQASSSKPHTPEKENSYGKPCTILGPRNTGKGNALVKKRADTKSNKASNDVMHRHEAEGACFYYDESGHMTNECSNNAVKTNHVLLAEKSPDSREGKD